MSHAHLVFITQAGVTLCDACGEQVDGAGWQPKVAHWRDWHLRIAAAREERRAAIEEVS